MLFAVALLQCVEQECGEHAPGSEVLVIFEAGDQGADRFLVAGSGHGGVDAGALQAASATESLSAGRQWQCTARAAVGRTCEGTLTGGAQVELGQAGLLAQHAYRR